MANRLGHQVRGAVPEHLKPFRESTVTISSATSRSSGRFRSVAAVHLGGDGRLGQLRPDLLRDLVGVVPCGTCFTDPSGSVTLMAAMA